MKTKFKNLFSPLKVRGVVFPNRIFLSPQGHSPKHRHPSSFDSEYDCGMMFYDKSQGGFGAAEISYATHNIIDGDYEKLSRDQIRELQSMCTQTGAKCGTSVGSFMSFRNYKDNADLVARTYEIKVKGGTPKGAPTQINLPPGTIVNRIQYRASDGVWDGISCFEMPKEMIFASIEETKEAARVAMKYDFDFVSLAGLAFGGTLSSFIAEKQNHRADEFGGSAENRCRYPLMMLQAIREVVGPNVPIVTTLSPSIRDERAADLSQTPDEMIDFLKRAQGLLDVAIFASGMDTTNLWNSNVFHCGTIFQPKAQELEFSKRVKQEAPEIICVPRGGMNEPEVMEEILANGWADAVCIGRQFVADPYWPKKTLENRTEDIIPCIRCDHCYHSATDHHLLSCSVNPRLFRERRVPLKESLAEKSKHLVVIGGGPGGCRAAITAAERGHRVTLIEKTDSLGGLLKHAVYDNHKTDLVRYVNYLKIQVAKHDNIEVLYNTTATPKMVEKMDPDAVLVAIGAEPKIPEIKGIEKAREAVDCWEHQKEISRKVVIIGGGQIGAELCLQLAETGHQVTVISHSDELATSGHFFYKIGLQHALQDVEDNWKALFRCSCQEVRDNGVIYVDGEGKEHFEEADTVIYAGGLRSRREEAQAFYGIADQTAMVGDCNRVGKVLQANTEAYFFAHNL